MRSLLHAKLYPIEAKKGSLKIPLGRTLYGKLVLLDLGKMPHVKIAGLTGFGKTAMLSTFLYFLCNQLSPQELQIVIIDRKGASYSAWSREPHIAGIYVATEDVELALGACVSLMRRRLGMIDEKRAAFQPLPRFPHVVILIDEGGELTPADAIGDEQELRKRCMAHLSTLARIGREPNMHLIYATQRPDATTLPMTVRGQLDHTICFRVRERGDSRVVLGNEHGVDLAVLPGRAYYQVGANETEFQAVYIPEDSLEGWLYQQVEQPDLKS